MPRPRDSTISYSSFLRLLQPDAAVESVFSRVPLVLQLVYQALKAFSCILLAIAETLAEEAAAQAFLLLLLLFFLLQHVGQNVQFLLSGTSSAECHYRSL